MNDAGVELQTPLVRVVRLPQRALDELTPHRTEAARPTVLDVHVAGPVVPETGMVVNLKDLKQILQEAVVEPLDFKNLNLQVDYFQNRLTTLENLAQLLWDCLKPRIDSLSLELVGLRIAESDDLYVEYYGGKELPQ